MQDQGDRTLQTSSQIISALASVLAKGGNFRVLFEKSNGDIRYMSVSRLMGMRDDLVTVYDDIKQDIRRFKISRTLCIELNLENPPMNENQIQTIKQKYISRKSG